MKPVFAVILICTALGFVFSTVPLMVRASSSSVNINPPNSKPYNLTYPDHAKNFWKWALEMPVSENPVTDQSGEKCANGQSNTNSSVFYLTFNNGGKSERTCKVPAGKALLIPVMQVEWSDKESPGATVDDLRSAAKKNQDSVNSLYLKIGDKEYNYQDLLKYRTQPTEPFEVMYSDNGLFGIAKGGPSKVVADGFYILTEPLERGTYPIHFKSSLICSDPGCAEPNFAQDIQYTIIAE